MLRDTYTKYNPADFLYGEYPVCDIKSLPVYYEWDYGDTFTLTFKLGKKALLETYDVYIYIYNFRHDLIYETTPDELIIDCNGNVSFYINLELSEKLIKGTYSCQVLIGNEDELLTLIRPSDCTLYVR